MALVNLDQFNEKFIQKIKYNIKNGDVNDYFGF